MKKYRVFLCDCFLFVFVIALFVYCCTLIKSPFIRILLAGGILLCVNKILRGIMLIIDIKTGSLAMDACITFAYGQSLDFFHRVKYCDISMEDLNGKKMGKYSCFDEEVLEELHIDDVIHMEYYPRSRIILSIKRKDS